jgi:hypothetical protein
MIAIDTLGRPTESGRSNRSELSLSGISKKVDMWTLEGPNSSGFVQALAEAGQEPLVNPIGISRSRMSAF